jgi:phage shock protein E
MLNLLKRFFAPKGPSLAELLADGAMVVDVRTPQEYRGGHVEGSRNIPLSSLSSKVTSLKKQKKTIITCCASGMRSNKAAKVLRQAGLNAHNGGAWQTVERARKEA